MQRNDLRQKVTNIEPDIDVVVNSKQHIKLFDV